MHTLATFNQEYNLYKITKIMDLFNYTARKASTVATDVEYRKTYNFEYTLESGYTYKSSRILDSQVQEDGSINIRTNLSIFNIKSLQ